MHWSHGRRTVTCGADSGWGVVRRTLHDATRERNWSLLTPSIFMPLVYPVSSWG
ncbi:hypothetical protein RB200_06280 [Streptomyces sp. PmtG]